MKHFLLSALVLLGATMLQAQTANEIINYTLVNGDIIYPYNMSPDYDAQENTIVSKYETEISANGIFKAETAGSQNSLYSGIMEALHQLCRAELPVFQVWVYDDINAVHRLARNKKFRTYLSGKVNSFLKGLCDIYPGGFQRIALAKIDEADQLIMEISKHKYTIATYTYNGGYTEEVIVKDGHHCIEADDYQLVHGLEGWLVRRMLTDQIPLVEMRNYLQAARKVVVAQQNDSKPEFEKIYNINGRLKICTLPERVMCVLEDGTPLEYIYKLQYFESKHGVFFKFVGEQDYDFEHSSWVAPYGLFAPDGTLIMSGTEWNAPSY